MQKNRMADTPMGKLMFSMAFPLMVSMLVQAVYNIVDSLFVSRITSATVALAGDKAVMALTLAFPLQMLMTACNSGTGVGINAMLSRFLGMGNREKASTVGGNGAFCETVIAAVFCILGFTLVGPYVRTQTSDPDTIAYAVSYLRIVMCCCFFNMWYFSFEKILQATGRATLTMIAQLSGAVANIILDPIFIFGLKMGVSGAAVATVLGQMISMLVAGYVFFRKTDDIDKGLRYMKPDGALIKAIYKIGVPAAVMTGLSSVMSYGMNIILGTVSASMVTAFGIYYKLQNFIFMPAFGLNNAAVPIVGFSYGARRKDRIKQALKVGLMFSMSIMAAGIILVMVFARGIAGFFAVSEEIQQMAASALRIICIGYLLAGFSVLMQGFFQALGNGVYSLVVSLFRMVIVLLPAAKLLTMTASPRTTVWWAFPIAELAAALTAVVLLIRIWKKVVAPLPDGPAEDDAAWHNAGVK